VLLVHFGRAACGLTVPSSSSYPFVPMLYAEHWSARPAWTALPVQERIAFLDQLGPDIDRLHASGAVLVGAALRETRRLHRTDCYYVALWRMPEGASQVQTLNAILEAAGWDRYFEPALTASEAWSGAEKSGQVRPPKRDARFCSFLNGDRREES